MRVTPVSLPFAACLLSQNKDELRLENTITEDLLSKNKTILIKYRESSRRASRRYRNAPGGRALPTQSFSSIVYLYLSFAEVSECPRRPSTALDFLKHRRRRSSCRLAQSRRRGGAGKAVRVPKVSGKRLLFKITKDDQQGIIVTFSFQGLHQEGRQVEAPPQPTPSALRARCPLTGLTFTFRAQKFSTTKSVSGQGRDD